MEVFYRIVALLGGLALFLYGMQVMGDGLKNSSGGALKAALARVTNKPAMGFILGMFVTAMIQSSTATIVLTVGLVGAGFLTFNQSIGIILGANVGTAITAQVIRLMDVEADASSILYFFKSDNLSAMALVIGIVLLMFIKKRSASAVGTICMGFGILFVGLVNMSAAVSTMSDSLSHLLVAFENNYFLGFLSGVGVTGIIQSSSAVVGILQSIASSVGVHFCGVFAVIIGVNIGDCITTFLVCRIGAKPEQVRACMIHIIYNVCAALLIFAAVLIGHGTGLIPEAVWNAKLNSGGVANVHGMFRLIPAVLLLPCSGFFAKIAARIVPDKPVDTEDADIEKNLRELDPRLIENPSIALSESNHLIDHMSDVAFKNYTAAVNQIFGFTEKRHGKIQHREDLLDRMTDAANQYVLAITPHVTLQSDDVAQNFQLKVMTIFERIGDRADNINDSMAKLNAANKAFSPAAQADIRVLTDAVRETLEISVQAYKNLDYTLARRIEPMEEVVDELVEALRNRHVTRMTKGVCEALNGIEYENVLQTLGRVSDQCSDLGVYLLSMNDPSIRGNEHRYIHNLHHSNDQEYLGHFTEAYNKYFGMLNSINDENSKVTVMDPETITD
ncbi:MAG: Na/Pi cotransporter family protein [Eubacteriales bacterium]|nr:Na/Pi cotransporter family protein [Eubacteriales bacterium]